MSLHSYSLQSPVNLHAIKLTIYKILKFMHSTIEPNYSKQH